MTRPAATVRTIFLPGSLVMVSLRRPDEGETPLSDSEIFHGMTVGLIAVLPLPNSPQRGTP